MGAVLPLLALRAFVETGRHGSLKAAAEVMGVTPGGGEPTVETVK